MPAIGYHFSAKVISRAKGQSAVASVSYRTAEKLKDERLDKVFDYTRKQGVEFVYHAAPKDAPEWVHDIGQAWNQVERIENRKNSTLAREFEAAFPHELTDQQRAWMLKDFVREELTRKGFLATSAIHTPSHDGDERNYHVHIMLAERQLDADGFAKAKDRRFSDFATRDETLDGLKEKWADLCARQLERAGLPVEAERWRHGHKTLAEQRSLALARGDDAYAVECDRQPTQHLGPVATEIERDGRESHRGNENRAIEADNAERQRIKQEAARLEQQHAALERQEQRLEAHPTVRAINQAWERSDSAASFAAALREEGVVIARVSEQDAARRRKARDAAQEAQAERLPPELTAGDLYAIEQGGMACRLDATTLKADEQDIAARLAAFAPDTTPSLAEAWRKERREQEFNARHEKPQQEYPVAHEQESKPLALRRLESYGERKAIRQANPTRDYSALRETHVRVGEALNQDHAMPEKPAVRKVPNKTTADQTPMQHDAEMLERIERNRALLREEQERDRRRERER